MATQLRDIGDVSSTVLASRDQAMAAQALGEGSIIGAGSATNARHISAAILKHAPGSVDNSDIVGPINQPMHILNQINAIYAHEGNTYSASGMNNVCDVSYGFKEEPEVYNKAVGVIVRPSARQHGTLKPANTLHVTYYLKYDTQKRSASFTITRDEIEAARQALDAAYKSNAYLLTNTVTEKEAGSGVIEARAKEYGDRLLSAVEQYIAPKARDAGFALSLGILEELRLQMEEDCVELPLAEALLNTVPEIEALSRDRTNDVSDMQWRVRKSTQRHLNYMYIQAAANSMNGMRTRPLKMLHGLINTMDAMANNVSKSAGRVAATVVPVIVARDGAVIPIKGFISMTKPVLECLKSRFQGADVILNGRRAGRVPIKLFSQDGYFRDGEKMVRRADGRTVDLVNMAKVNKASMNRPLAKLMTRKQKTDTTAIFRELVGMADDVAGQDNGPQEVVLGTIEVDNADTYYVVSTDGRAVILEDTEGKNLNIAIGSRVRDTARFMSVTSSGDADRPNDKLLLNFYAQTKDDGVRKYYGEKANMYARKPVNAHLGSFNAATHKFHTREALAAYLCPALFDVPGITGALNDTHKNLLRGVADMKPALSAVDAALRKKLWTPLLRANKIDAYLKMRHGDDLGNAAMMQTFSPYVEINTVREGGNGEIKFVGQPRVRYGEIPMTEMSLYEHLAFARMHEMSSTRTEAISTAILECRSIVRDLRAALKAGEAFYFVDLVDRATLFALDVAAHKDGNPVQNSDPFNTMRARFRKNFLVVYDAVIELIGEIAGPFVNDIFETSYKAVGERIIWPLIAQGKTAGLGMRKIKRGQNDETEERTLMTIGERGGSWKSEAVLNTILLPRIVHLLNADALTQMKLHPCQELLAGISMARRLTPKSLAVMVELNMPMGLSVDYLRVIETVENKMVATQVNSRTAILTPKPLRCENLGFGGINVSVDSTVQSASNMAAGSGIIASTCLGEVGLNDTAMIENRPVIAMDWLHTTGKTLTQYMASLKTRLTAADAENPVIAELDTITEVFAPLEAIVSKAPKTSINNALPLHNNVFSEAEYDAYVPMLRPTARPTCNPRNYLGRARHEAIPIKKTGYSAAEMIKEFYTSELTTANPYISSFGGVYNFMYTPNGFKVSAGINNDSQGVWVFTTPYKVRNGLCSKTGRVLQEALNFGETTPNVIDVRTERAMTNFIGKRLGMDSRQYEPIDTPHTNLPGVSRYIRAQDKTLQVGVAFPMTQWNDYEAGRVAMTKPASVTIDEYRNVTVRSVLDKRRTAEEEGQDLPFAMM